MDLEGVNEHVANIIEAYGEIARPELNDDDPMGIIYDRADGIRCMTCARPVGEDAQIVVADHGWEMLFCHHDCMVEMILCNWLADMYTELNQRIKERSEDQ